MLAIENISFNYGEKPLLENLNFSVKEGEIVSLIGTSGSGKTTLFRLITGLLLPKQGSLLINGIPLPKGQENVTYMRQEDFLLSWRTVLQNLLLFTELGKKRVKKSLLMDEALELLERVGLKGYEQHYPHQLSGGMRQRVSLARALLRKRPLLLLDEPFGSLDILIREDLYQLLQWVRSSYKKTILFVTHDFRDAVSLSDRILILSEGKIKKEFELPPNQHERLKLETEMLPAIRSSLSSSNVTR